MLGGDERTFLGLQRSQSWGTKLTLGHGSEKGQMTVGSISSKGLAYAAHHNKPALPGKGAKMFAQVMHLLPAARLTVKTPLRKR